MARLFEIRDDFNEWYNRLDEIEEIEDDTEREEMRQAWFDTMEALEGELEAKCESTAQYIKAMEAEADAIDADIKKQRKRVQSRRNRVQWLKQYLQSAMESTETPKIETARVRITLRNNPKSVQIKDEAALIDELEKMGYLDALEVQQPKIKKSVVKQYLQAEENGLKNAELRATKSVVIA